MVPAVDGTNDMWYFYPAVIDWVVSLQLPSHLNASGHAGVAAPLGEMHSLALRETK